MARPVKEFELAPDLVAHLLQYVPMEQRLGQCALVCQLWAVAAAQATTSIECCITSSTRESLEAWLEQHATHLVSLKLTSCPIKDFDMPELQLPCLAKLSGLQHLSAFRCTLQFAGASQQQSDDPDIIPNSSSSMELDGLPLASPPLMPHVQELHLRSCRLPSIYSVVDLLAAAPNLTTVVVNCCAFAKYPAGQAASSTAMQPWPSSWSSCRPCQSCSCCGKQASQGGYTSCVNTCRQDGACTGSPSKHLSLVNLAACKQRNEYSQHGAVAAKTCMQAGQS